MSLMILRSSVVISTITAVATLVVVILRPDREFAAMVGPLAAILSFGVATAVIGAIPKVVEHQRFRRRFRDIKVDLTLAEGPSLTVSAFPNGPTGLGKLTGFLTLAWQAESAGSLTLNSELMVDAPDGVKRCAWRLPEDATDALRRSRFVAVLVTIESDAGWRTRRHFESKR